MAFDAREDKVRDLFNRKVYEIPRNQRGYVWNKNNWEEMFDDVMCVVDGKLSSHFLGSIVLKTMNSMPNGLPCYSIIDGQQRTITLAIFISSIMYWMKRLKMEDDFNGTLPYVIAKDDKNKDIVMVTAENNPSLENIIKSITIENNKDILKRPPAVFIDSETVQKSDKNIANAFKFFIAKINEIYASRNEDENIILKLRNAVRDITFINITATTEEDSYTIFESLNARGLDLEDHELLKNYIMRYIQPEENRDKAKTEWQQIEKKLGYTNLKKFVRHYTIHRYGRYKSKNDKSDYKIIQKYNKSKDTEKLLRDLEKKSDYYLKLIAPTKEGDNANCSENEYRVFSFFKKKRQEQMRPVLLSLITKNIEQELSDDLYNKTIEFLYNFYICYNIIGEENSNKLTGTVNKYADLLSNNFSKQTLESFVDDLKKKLPSKDMFINSFKNVGWSKQNSIYEGNKNKDRVQTILEVLERYENHDNWCEDFTIEHVNPDAENTGNGQIGNLLPLEEHLNRKCGDKEIQEKLGYYSESSFKITRAFAERYKKLNFNPDERTKKMAIKFYDEILKL